MIFWYVDDYVTLNDEQEVKFINMVKETLAWHKQQELPRYRQFLQGVHDKLDQPLNEDDINDMQDFMTVAFQTLQQYIAPTILPLFKTLNAEQQQTFWAEIDRKQVKYEKERLSKSNEEYANDLNERYRAFSERLLGALTEDQEALIANRVNNAIRADDVWLKSRRAWLSNIKTQSEQPTDDWQARVQAAWLDRDPNYSTEEQLTIHKRDKQARQLLLAVVNSRTDKQNEHFKKFIRDWQGKFARWQE